MTCFEAQYAQEKSSLRAASIFEPPDHIIDNIFLGSESSAISLEGLSSRRITRVLIVAAFCEPRFPEAIEYKQMCVDDSPTEDIKRFFEEAFAYIQKDPSTNTLVHCISGISRSATIVIAYLMRYKSMNMQDAWLFTRRMRSIVHPNSGFQRQLLEYEVELRSDSAV
jgi:hypothetical protein